MVGLSFRRSSSVIAALAMSIALAACGGGGGGGSAVPPPGGGATPTPIPTTNPTPTPSTSTGSFAVSPASGGSTSLGPVAGPQGNYTGTVGFPTSTSGSATVTATLSSTLPSGAPALSAMRRKPAAIGVAGIAPLVYLTLSASAAISFANTPTITVVLPLTVTPSSVYLGLYDPSQPLSGWNFVQITPTVSNGNTLTFSTTVASVGLTAGSSTYFALFASPLALPTPSPTATPVVTPSTTPTPNPNGSTKSFTVTSTGTSPVTFGTIPGGVGASMTMPATTGGSATLTATLTAAPPSGVPTVSDAARRPKSVGGTLMPIAYITMSSSASVSFKLTPGLVATPVGIVPTYGYLAVYNPDPTVGWTAAAGATTKIGSTFTFAPLDAGYTITPGTNFVVAIFASPTLVAVAPPGNTDVCSSSAVRPNGSRRLAQSLAGQSQTVSDRLYVTRRADERTASSMRNSVAALRTVPLGGENGVVHEAITLPAGSDATKVAAQLRGLAGVVDVAAVHRRFLTGDAAANDTLLDNDQQWYLSITNVDPGAWALSHGTGIKVAVIDTGVDETNADLGPKLDKTLSIVGGIVTTSAQDTNAHGSNVSSLVAATTNNAYGFAGTGWDVHLLVYKIFPDTTSTVDCQGADTVDEAAAIRDAVASGASVINLSLGSPNSGGVDAAEQAAVAFAIQNNVTVVAANGNEGVGFLPDYPAAYPGVIAVGASTVTDAVPNVYSSITGEGIAYYSNDTPTLVAPGGDARGDDPAAPPDFLHWIAGYGTTTANLPADRCSNSGGVCVVLFNGTSQATPQVSAAVALMMAKHGGTRSLTPSQALNILTTTAHKLPPTISTTRQGFGRLDVQAAVAGS
ncbi:MAG: putative subtilase-family protease [Candidatus Eremiobacteraeota bacterium]|nr:putative subtilase-family protease [Candidatus Eremiobacteraeota bacterium]